MSCGNVQIWDMQSGESLTNIEPNRGELHDVCVWPNSGLMFTATNSPHIGVYFTPDLGPAPKW